jgi:SRSO17 transposase
MSIQIIEIPKELKKSLENYRDIFTKPQFNHFKNLITGLIVSDNKTLQEINDCFGEKDQSSLNRFMTCSDWNEQEVEQARMNQIKSKNISTGFMIVDPTLLHKTGKHMEKANYHYDGLTKGKEWGHLLVNSLFSNQEISFPINADFYLRKEDADKEHKFKTSREICLEHIDYAIKNNLPIEAVLIDAGLYADYVLKHIISKQLKFVAGINITTKISINREEKISIGDYLLTLKKRDFKKFKINEEFYFLHSIEVYVRRVGKVKLLISYKKGDKKNIKTYITNILNETDEELMKILLKRWNVETLHRDSKQHLGLEDYQVRKFGAIQKVVRAVLVAYTQIALNVEQKILEPLKRNLETIGESCRFFRLIATKGWRWLKRKARSIEKLKDVMNRLVFVKNAKV